MNYKGYNGFNDISTYEFANTGQRIPNENYNNTAYETVRCTRVGVPIDFETWIDNHLNLLNTIDENDSRTWLKMYDGMYMYEFSRDSGNPNIFNVGIIFHELVVIAENQTYTQSDVKARLMLEKFRFHAGLEVALAHFDYRQNYQTVYAPSSFRFLCAPNSVTVSGTGYAPASFSDISPIGEVEPEYPKDLTPYDITVSGDSTDTWYSIFGNLAVLNFGGVPISQDTDTSEPDVGGDGDYGQEDSDDIPDDGVPTITAISSGFVKMYNPSISQLLSLRNFMYNDSFINSVKKLLSNPLEYIISLKLIACLPNTGTSEDIGVGGVSSEVSAPTVLNQYKQFNCGTVFIDESYGGFPDYAPMTDITIYLPFIGTQHIETNLAMKASVNLIYAVDFLTGDCVAKLSIQNNHELNAQVYFFNGNCACEIPMSGMDWSQKYISQLKGVGAIASGNVGAMVGSAMDIALSKPKFERVGSIGHSNGMMSNYTPYIMIERPAQSFPEFNNNLLGRPSNIGGRVDSFSGYTEIEEIKLDGIQATDSELDEIRQLLADGVYI